MINEDKVKLMTKVAIFEKNEEKEGLVLSKYFQEDYVKNGCLRTLVTTSFCYFLVLALYVIMNYNELLDQLNEMDYFGMIKKLMTYYVLIAAFFVILGFFVYNIRYHMAKAGLIEYNHNLKKLLRYYGIGRKKKKNEKIKATVRSGIGMDDFDDYDYDDGFSDDMSGRM